MEYVKYEFNIESTPPIQQSIFTISLNSSTFQLRKPEYAIFATWEAISRPAISHALVVERQELLLIA